MSHVSAKYIPESAFTESGTVGTTAAQLRAEDLPCLYVKITNNETTSTNYLYIGFQSEYTEWKVHPGVSFSDREW